MNQTKQPSGRAFTLVELLLVLVVMALLTGTAVVKLASVFQDVTLDDAVRRVKELDRVARDRARNAGSAVEIVWVDDEHRGFYREQRDVERTERARTRLGKYSINVTTNAGAAQRDANRSKASVFCSPAGYTRSYAVHLRSPDGRGERHLVFMGLTGEVKVFDDERAVQQLFAAASRAPTTAGDDAP